MSLRLKFPVAAGVCVVISLMAYLLVDAILTRSFLLKEQAQTLHSLAQLACSDIQESSFGSYSHSQKVVERFKQHHGSIELIYIKHDSTVLAASRPDIVGRFWREEGIQQVLDGETEFHWATMDHHDQPVIDITIPCQLDESLGAVHIAQTMQRAEEHMNELRIRHILFSIGAALTAGLFLSILTYFLVIRRLSRLARDLNVLDVKGRTKPPLTKSDEIKQLSKGLRELVGGLTDTKGELEAALDEKNRLLHRVERFNEELEGEIELVRKELLVAQEELLRAEHLSTVSQLAAGLAHELRNPLFIIRASAEAHARKCADSEEVSTDIIEEVDRVDQILSRLLDLGTPLSVELREVDLLAVLSDAITKVEKGAGETVKIDCDAPEQVFILGDYHFLRQAFINVLTNAHDAIEKTKDGAIQVKVSTKSDGKVTVEFSDNGVGMSKEDMEGLFRPFFTKKPGGTGLGLCTARKIFDLHKAKVDVKSELGQGTQITLKLKVAPGEKR